MNTRRMKMTENDAIEALMGAFDEGQDTASEPQEVAQETSEAPVAEAPKETPKSEEATQKESAPAIMTPEQQAMLESMGLGDLGQIKEQLAQFQAAQAAAAEQARQQEIFNKNSAEFKKDFPTIKLEELGKFADENGFISVKISDICAKTNASKPTAIETIKLLESRKIFERVKNGIYRFKNLKELEKK